MKKSPGSMQTIFIVVFVELSINANFTLKDVSKSTTALRMGIDNTPHESAIMVAIEYVMTVVDQIKDRFPTVRINSFYRSSYIIYILCVFFVFY